MLEIEKACFKINDFKVFDIQSLTIKQGSNTAFIGRNGSGKSILVKALVGEQQLLFGKVLNEFKSITHISFEQLQKLIDDEWKRNNTDMLSEGENDTGLTTAQIIQENNSDNVLCQMLAKQFGITNLLSRRFKYL
jgi:molybdate transport system ATP-binding protein